MKNYRLISGDVTIPISEGNKIIIHCCNDLFVMGSGVALALRNKWPDVFNKYREWGIKDNPKLGDVQFVKVEPDIAVGNMLGQHGIGFTDGVPPIRYEAIDKALKTVAETAKKYGATVHLPYKMGADRAGGDWDKIEEMIRSNLCSQDIKVVIYKFNKADDSLNRREEQASKE